MENYEDLLVERLQNLTGKLAQKQRQGSLAEELDLCVKLAQLNGYLGNLKTSVQFWQSCMQIAADLGNRDEEWRAAAEIAKTYCKQGQMEAAESFMTQNLLKSADQSLRVSLLKAEVITAIGQGYSRLCATERSVKEFLEYERALKVLDGAFERTDSGDVWWWDAVAFRAELLTKLGKFEESRFEEAIDVIRAVQDGTSGNVLMSLRTSAILAKIYFEMGEHRTAYDFAVAVIDLYKSDASNSNYRQRRRFYSEMLLLAGRTLRFQLDFGFSLDNLLLALDEAQIIGVEGEFIREIEDATKETMNSKALFREISILRGKKNASPKDLEDLADKLGQMGDFQGQGEVLERCQAVAISEATRKRLEKKLAKVYFYRLKNWRGVTRLSCSERRLLILKGRAFEKLGDLEEAEDCLLEANKADGKESNIAGIAALYFYYRQRGKLTEAVKYEPEILDQETISFLSKTDHHQNTSVLIDPNFSYFATRKPSHSMMKMVGSGMVMRTKTKKTRGLMLKKRRRGPSKLNNNVRSKRKEVDEGIEGSGSESDGLSDFIVSDVAEAEESHVKTVNKILRSFVVISDEEDEDEDFDVNVTETQSNMQFHDSPLLIRTETLENIFKEHHNTSTQTGKKVFVRLKPGKQMVIPISDDLSVKELMREAQKRFESTFPEEAKSFGRICGFSLVDGGHEGARLFADDLLGLILSSDTLQAHFDKAISATVVDSPSKFHSIDEDFRRKMQILSLKPDSHEEINFLKSLQERFKRSTKDLLDLSKLNFDSEKFGEYSGLVNKFLKMSPGLKELNLAESCLSDSDLKYLTRVPGVVDLSNNFLMRPSASLLKDCEFVNLSYNEIDPTWLKSNVGHFKGLGLVGCFENCHFPDCLGQLKKLSVSVKPAGQSEFISSLGADSLIEELQLFAFDWRGSLADSLLELSYLDNLRVLDLSCNRFGPTPVSAIDFLCKILKRSCTLKKFVLEECDLDGEAWRRLEEEGIRGNFSLEEVFK